MPDRRPSAFDWSSAEVAHRDNLPHVRQENIVYFITFRLGDSIPADRMAELKERRDHWLDVNPPPHSVQQQMEYRRIWTAQFENLLDAGYGACVLKEAGCRDVVERTLRHDDGKRYQLGDFVIMPNHVHALVHFLPGQELSDAIKAWKSVSARAIGRLLGRSGSYWMDEYFDHAVRDEEAYRKLVRYIRENPRNLPEGTFTLGAGTLTV